MNGVVRIDLVNFITIGLMAFLFVWLANRGLDWAGQKNLTTEG